jgi:uncharacterized protein
LVKKIILDTNFLLIPGYFAVDIISEIERITLFSYKLYVIDKTLEELESLRKKLKGKEKVAVNLASAVIKQNNIKIIETKENTGHVDEILIRISDKDTIVATQDSELRKRLKKKDIQVIVLRQKKYLQIS